MLRAGDLVQVHNPVPMAKGMVINPDAGMERRSDGTVTSFTLVDFNGHRVKAQSRLLRLVATVESRGRR